jgi:hypothetical protein
MTDKPSDNLIVDNASVSGGVKELPGRKKNAKKPKDPIARDFRKICKEVKSKSETLEADIKSGKFSEDKKDILTQLTKKGKSLLHMITEKFTSEEEEGSESEDDNDSDTSDSTNTVLKLLVQELVKQHGDLMLTNVDENKDDKTPLRIAIDASHDSLVEWICEVSTNLSHVLKIPFKGKNCVHAAIQSELPHEVIIHLIEKANQDALCAQDDSGFTPLHLAVEYERCDKEQLEVVQALVRQGDGALDLEAEEAENFSVYRYHEHTRKLSIAKKELQKDRSPSKPEERDRGIKPAQQPLESANAKDTIEDGRKPPKPAPPAPPLPPQLQNQKFENVAARTSANVGHKLNEGGPRRQNSNPIEPKYKQDPILNTPTRSQHESNQPLHSISGNLQSSPVPTAGLAVTGQPEKDEGKKSFDLEEEKLKSAEEIREFIKLHYLRTRDTEKAAAWLYGKNTEGWCLLILENAVELMC